MKPSTSGFDNIGWTVGNYCNARCGHCYSWQVRRDSTEFLTTSDIERVVSQLVSLGVRTVNLGGNEPIYTNGQKIEDTLLPFIIQTLNDAAIPVGLTTNGISFSYLDRHFPVQLQMVNDIDFSLDSPYSDEHDLNRGNRLFSHVLEQVTRSLELGIDCSIIACGMRENFNRDYLEAFLSLTKHLGSEFRVNTLKPVERSLIDAMPTPKQFYEGFAYLMANSTCITLGESCLTAFTGTGDSGCPCGSTSFRINAKTKDGRIPLNPCVYMHGFKTGDLLTDDIHTIVESPEFMAFRNRRSALPAACRQSGCDFLESCRGGCSARSYLTYGDLDSKDPYCPQDYQDAYGRPNLPVRPNIGLDEGIRVHDHYLCTWIGKVNETFHLGEEFDAISKFQRSLGESSKHMSGHVQLTPEDSVQETLSVTPVHLATKDQIKRRRV